MFKANRFLAVIVMILFAVSMGSCGGGGGGGGGGGETTPQTIMSDLQKIAIEEDVEKMVVNFHPAIKDGYKSDFNYAKSVGLLDEIAEMLQTAQSVYIKENYAKFSVFIYENGKKIVFYIYLIKDTDGNWKIYSM